MSRRITSRSFQSDDAHNNVLNHPMDKCAFLFNTCQRDTCGHQPPTNKIAKHVAAYFDKQLTPRAVLLRHATVH